VAVPEFLSPIEHELRCTQAGNSPKRNSPGMTGLNSCHGGLSEWSSRISTFSAPAVAQRKHDRSWSFTRVLCYPARAPLSASSRFPRGHAKIAQPHRDSSETQFHISSSNHAAADAHVSPSGIARVGGTASSVTRKGRASGCSAAAASSARSSRSQVSSPSLSRHA
jgi:hypothetical protein